MNSGDFESRRDPDVALIDFVCDQLAPDLNLNKDLLANWKLELADHVKSLPVLSALIEDEVVLGSPLRSSPTRLSLDAVNSFLDQLMSLDDQLYHELKIIMMEVFVTIITASYTAKIYTIRDTINEALIDNFLAMAKKPPIESLSFDYDVPNLLNQHIRAIMELMELGCSIKTLKKIFHQLISSRNVHERLIILELLTNAQDNYPQNFNFTLFNNFRARSVAIPFTNTFNSAKCFTFHTWLRLNCVGRPSSQSHADEVDSTTLFVLTDSKNTSSSTLVIDLINQNQFMIEVKNNSNQSRMQFSFNQIINTDSTKTQGFIHVVFTYDKTCNLNLYIDGEFSESIPCPELNKGIETWDKAYIGSSDRIIESKDELIISNLTVLDVALTPQWINLFYNLGLDFVWNFQDFSNENLYNLLTHLSFRGLANLSIKVKELSSKRKRGNSFRDSLGHLVHGDQTSDQLSSENKHLANGVVLKNMIDKHAIVSLLANCRVKQSDIIFDCNDDGFLDGLELPQGTQILHHKSTSMSNAFYVMGGSSLMLELVESILQECKARKPDFDKVLQTTLKFILGSLNNNWRLNKEFENINGYGILQIMLTNYKTINKTLQFNTPPQFKTDETNKDLLRLISRYVGYDFSDPYESVIINPSAYRYLILCFEMYYETPSFEFLFSQLVTFLTESRHNELNKMELNKMKILKRTLHFAKSPTLAQQVISKNELESFRKVLYHIVRTDLSVENITSVSHFVIYALYSPRGECNEAFGLAALDVLADLLCNENTTMKVLKKFSRSITVHWILLLLSYRAEDVSINAKAVVKSGIRHLTKLLTILGTNVINKFFQVNRGLDILTHFLKDWWADDDVICQMFLAAFGLDLTDYNGVTISLVDIIPPIDSPDSQKFDKLVLPDFLMLLNNLVLNSVYVLSEKKGKVLSAPSSPSRSEVSMDISLDAIHLISQYAKAIEKGHHTIKSLSEFYVQKDWLDGIFELIGYIKLFLTWESSDLFISFKNCYRRLTRVISDIFISKLFNSNKFFEIFHNLSDFTKKLILDIVFPNIFTHINGFIAVAKFIYKEKEFVNESAHLLNFYHSEYFKQGYKIDKNALSQYLSCLLGIVEISSDTNAGLSRQLKSNVGDVLIWKLRNDSDQIRTEVADTVTEAASVDEEDTSTGASSFNDTVSLLLYRQMLVFQKDVLSKEQLALVLAFLIGVYFKVPSSPSEINVANLFNLLRAAQIMRQEEMPAIINIMTSGIDYSASNKYVNEFFSILLARNDEETSKAVGKVPTYRHIFNQCNYMAWSRYKEGSKMNIADMINVTLNNGGTLGMLDNIYIKSFERDCNQLRTQLYNKELTKFNRMNQDQRETINYFSASYHALKIETRRLFNLETKPCSYVLDYIESFERTRARLVIEDQMSDGERLSYNIDIPLKQVKNAEENAYDKYSYAIDNSGIDTLSLSTDDVFSGLDEGYEIVEESQTAKETENSAYEDKNRKVLRSLYLGDQIVALWNTSLINGLAPVESLMILGSTHLYLIENYFHLKDGNVVDVQDAPLSLRDPYLQLINSQSSNFLSSGNNTRSHSSKNWALDTLSSISKRQFLLRDIALEMFFTDGASILFTCLTSKERDNIYTRLHSYCVGKGLDTDLTQTLNLSSNMSSLNSPGGFLASKLVSAFSIGPSETMLGATRKWRMGEMSNFYYLMIINTLAGRTFNDLTQYPVFPWVIADYTSEALDFSNPKTFRDLSKPMGAQKEPRASNFRERYEALKSLEDENSPAFHYGTHYSSAMIVSSFLIRLKPFVQSYLLLQGGKFDHADRLFSSIEKAWTSASQDNTTDVRELIPEFFFLPEFLVNLNNFEFGNSQTGEIVNDVELPPWAKNDPKLFIQKNREALESPYVSANLHLWIDFIFGYKQNGPEAVEALNVFHHLSYNGAINLDNINDDVERKAAIGMINNFGQTPKQIFTKPHLAKEVLQSPNNYFTAIDDKFEAKLVFESKLRCSIKKIEVSAKSGKWVGRPNCVCSEDDLLIRKTGNLSDISGSIIVNNTPFLNIHRGDITVILQIGYKMFLSGSDDGMINIWKCNLKPSLSLQFAGVLRGHLSKVLELKFSKSFKIGLSSDIDGNVIVWDFTRFKFIRQFKVNNADNLKIDVSNDSGNIAVYRRSGERNIIQLLTINGELIVEQELPPGDVSSMRFGSINDPRVTTSKNATTNSHVYWTHEMMSFAYGGAGRCIRIYELKPGDRWQLHLVSNLKIGSGADVTTHEVFKKSIVDHEDMLIRGYNGLIYGDTQGRVYQW